MKCLNDAEGPLAKNKLQRPLFFFFVFFALCLALIFNYDRPEEATGSCCGFIFVCS